MRIGTTIVLALSRLALLVGISLSPILAVAQNTASIVVYSDGKPVPYYSISSDKNFLVADSLGKCIIPKHFFNKKFLIHTLAKDTVVLVNEENLELHINANIQLPEVKVYSNLNLGVVKKFKTPYNIFSSYAYSVSNNIQVEHGKFFDFTNDIVLISYQVKIFNANTTAQTALLEIYSVDKKGNLKLIEPNANEIVLGVKSNNHLTFDLTNRNKVVLSKGKYFFVIRLLPSKRGLFIGFNLVKNSNNFTRMRYEKWYKGVSPTGKPFDLITDLKYREVLK